MLRRSFLSALVGFAILAACGGDSSGPGDTNIVGSYTLQSVNGNPVPWRAIVIGNDWFEIRGGSGSINADGTYSLTFNWRESVAGQTDEGSESSVGTYTRNGSAITFRDASDGSTASGTITGRQISVTSEGVVLVYARN
jgi:hypothetical protein